MSHAELHKQGWRPRTPDTKAACDRATAARNAERRQQYGQAWGRDMQACELACPPCARGEKPHG